MSIVKKDDTVVVKDGFLYLPMLYDEEVGNELSRKTWQPSNLLRTSKEEGRLVKEGRELFIRSVSLDSLVKEYEQFDSSRYAAARKELYNETGSPQQRVRCDSIDNRIRMLIEGVLPRYVRLDSEKTDAEGIYSALQDRLSIPETYTRKAANFFDYGTLKKRLREIEEQQGFTFPEGVMDGKTFDSYLGEALKSEVLRREMQHLRNLLQERENEIQEELPPIAVSLYVQENGMELDGFGIIPTNNGSFVTYCRTGEYALQDFDGALYRFPDCRVGVVLSSDVSHPKVLDTYAHPFLPEKKAMQDICIRNYRNNRGLHGHNVIRAIEDGMNTILYGYFNSDDFNGYHSLDGRVHNNRVGISFKRNRCDKPTLQRRNIPITNTVIS